MEPRWLAWARTLQAVAQTGLTYYKLFFRCELIGGAAAPSPETEGEVFFRESDLPELSTARVTPAQIARLFEHYRHPDWPTDFD
jgi:Hydrolase of X-linked nucleoside diphosphate N terminal